MQDALHFNWIKPQGKSTKEPHTHHIIIHLDFDCVIWFYVIIIDACVNVNKFHFRVIKYLYCCSCSRSCRRRRRRRLLLSVAFLMLPTAVVVESHQRIITAETDIVHWNWYWIENARNWLKFVAFSINSDGTACKIEKQRSLALNFGSKAEWLCVCVCANSTKRHILCATSIINFVGVWADRIGGTNTCCNGFGSLFFLRIKTPANNKKKWEHLQIAGSASNSIIITVINSNVYCWRMLSQQKHTHHNHCKSVPIMNNSTRRQVCNYSWSDCNIINTALIVFTSLCLPLSLSLSLSFILCEFLFFKLNKRYSLEFTQPPITVAWAAWPRVRIQPWNRRELKNIDDYFNNIWLFWVMCACCLFLRWRHAAGYYYRLPCSSPYIYVDALAIVLLPNCFVLL